jgi:hypothetical protein
MQQVRTAGHLNNVFVKLAGGEIFFAPAVHCSIVFPVRRDGAILKAKASLLPSQTPQPVHPEDLGIKKIEWVEQ